MALNKLPMHQYSAITVYTLRVVETNHPCKRFRVLHSELLPAINIGLRAQLAAYLYFIRTVDTGVSHSISQNRLCVQCSFNDFQ